MPTPKAYAVIVKIEPEVSTSPWQEDPSLAFTVSSRTHDAARDEARSKLEANGRIVRSIGFSPDNGGTFVAMVMRKVGPKKLVMGGAQ